MNGRGQYGSSFARGQYGGAFGHAAPTYGSGGYARIDHAQHWGLVARGNDRGQYGHRVGATGIDGTGWGIMPLTELNEIDVAARALNNALEAQVFKLANAPYSPLAPSASKAALLAHATGVTAVLAHASHNDPRVSFFASQWLPWKEKWNAFYVDQSSLLTQAEDLLGPIGALARSRYFEMQPYRAGLIEMYQKARALGFQGLPADPAAPNVSSTEGLPSVGDLVKYAKYGAIGLAAVLGVIVISNVASATRSH